MHQSPHGVILLFLVLIVGSVSVGALATVSGSSISSLTDASLTGQAWGTRAKVFGCLDETIIQLKKNANFAPLTVFTGQTTCTLTVTTPVQNERQVTLTLIENNISRRVQATVILSPFSVSQVIEQ